MAIINLKPEDLDQAVKDEIQGRIRHFIRNDSYISELIDKLLKEEIGKRVTKHLHRPFNKIENTIQTTIDCLVPSKQIVAEAAMRVIQDEVTAILKELLKVDDKEALRSLFEEEIKKQGKEKES